jgi:RHS repeat-associated protein
LDTAGVVSIELACEATRRRDGLGNAYRYRGIVHLVSGRSVPIWDVFLATTEAPTTQVAVVAPRGFAAAIGHRLVQVGAWVRRALAPRAGAAASRTPQVHRLASYSRSAAWWPVNGSPLMDAGPASAGGGESDDEGLAPATVQSPPPAPTQVVEYYHLDLLGSVRAVTNEQGVVIARHDFMPFGEEIAPQYPPTERKLFTGQERDFETGLDYFNARQYRPDLGQFTAPDPMSLAPMPVESQSLGSYTYVNNSPMNSVDPTGMSPFDLGSLGSFLAYLGSMFTGGTGWQPGGIPMGSIFGVSMSFSVGGSFSLSVGGSSQQPSAPQGPVGLPLTATEKAAMERDHVKPMLDLLSDMSAGSVEHSWAICRNCETRKLFRFPEFPRNINDPFHAPWIECPTDSDKIADLHAHTGDTWASPTADASHPGDQYLAKRYPNMYFYMTNMNRIHLEYTRWPTPFRIFK